MAQIAVLGLGRFGMNLARALADAGVYVFAADRRKDLVAEAAAHPKIDTAILDITDEDSLRGLDWKNTSVCVVGIGEGFEAAVLATYHLREIAKSNGMKVVARAQSVMQGEILRRVGADRVVQPESEFARLLARRLANPRLEDYLELDEQHGLVNLRAPREFVGRTIADVGLLRRYKLNLLSIKRPTGDAVGHRILVVPEDEDTIEAGDVLVLVGTNTALAELPKD